MDNNINIQSGSASFWADHAVLINGNTSLLSLDPEGGSILFFIEDGNIKVTFIVNGHGRTDISHPASSLSNGQKHLIALTWDLAGRLLVLYIDGTEAQRQTIAYTE